MPGTWCLDILERLPQAFQLYWQGFVQWSWTGPMEIQDASELWGGLATPSGLSDSNERGAGGERCSRAGEMPQAFVKGQARADAVYCPTGAPREGKRPTNGNSINASQGSCRKCEKQSWRTRDMFDLP